MTGTISHFYIVLCSNAVRLISIALIQLFFFALVVKSAAVMLHLRHVLVSNEFCYRYCHDMLMMP